MKAVLPFMVMLLPLMWVELPFTVTISVFTLVLIYDMPAVTFSSHL